MSRISTSNPFDDEDDMPWGAPVPVASPQATILQDALRKDKLISDITGLQEGLRALVNKIDAVQGETEKLAKENAILDQYIANLTSK